ncbi:MAG: hypothetical protein L3J31_00285 [Bacteroidales bacterium]|nr:hypothetical protein [Bacteroidales bacterium]MCF6341227.1 hypothetical protein [Bacteroidales bacterium]
MIIIVPKVVNLKAKSKFFGDKTLEVRSACHNEWLTNLLRKPAVENVRFRLSLLFLTFASCG